MGLSYTEEMRRQRRRIISANEKIAEHQSAKLELDRAISDLLDDVKSAEARIAEADARKAARVKFRFERIRTPVGELSKKRYVRVRQALHRVCDEEGIVAPAWVNAISDADIRFARREDLLERYVLSDGGIATAFDTDRRRAIADKLCDILKIESDPSEKLDDLRAVNPAFNYERALDIVIAGRAEFGVTDERGASARERHLLASTAWMRCVVRGDWIEDSASRLAARVGHDGGPKSLDSMKPPDGMKTGKLAAAIELSVNREKARSFAHEENDARLMQAVAIFATPGAMAAAARRGLSAEQRIFCAEWFAANRDLATQLGYRVGTEALFAELEKDSGLFRARYGAAPKIAPA
jgi:hypothetical protein